MPAKTIKRWTFDEDGRLKSLIEAGRSSIYVATKLKRTPNGVIARAKARAKGEGEIAMRLHERIQAMRHRRRRRPLRDRLRSRRRLVELGLKARK
jgi:hypothetical protein